MTDILTAALQYAAKGLPVFPCKRTDKRPLTKNGFKDAITDPDRIKAWWAKWPEAMIGIPTGKVIDVLDLDCKKGKDGFKAIPDWQDRSPIIVRTPSGGAHAWFQSEGTIKNTTDTIAIGVDTRGKGGYVIVPPSMNGSAAYRFEKGGLDQITKLPPFPADLAARCIKKKARPKAAQQQQQKPADPNADQLLIEALANIPNDDDLGWEEYKRVGMLVFARVGGDHQAWIEAFTPWSKRSKKHDDEGMQKTWIEINNSPPTQFDRDAILHVADKASPGWRAAVKIGDFIAYSPDHTYIFIPTRAQWSAASVNSRIAPIPLLKPKKGKQKSIQASTWLDQNRAVEQMTWAPGEPLEIHDRLVADAGWFERRGATCFNLYRPPTIVPGKASKATMWVRHILKVYGKEDGKHLINYCAHLVQHPQIKINHGIFMGGGPGIGKDTILEPVKRAIGPWNFQETTPRGMRGQFNSYLKAVALRISEAHDLGDTDRFSFYEQMKNITASPPDVHRINEKHIGEYYVLNCNGTFITSNHKTDGIYLKADDRRTYVMWSDLTEADFNEAYWNKIWHWYNNGGGDQDVAAYLATKDLSSKTGSDFNPKKPPKKTEAFWSIVNSNVAPEQSELADVLDDLGNPNAVTLKQVEDKAGNFSDLKPWLEDRRNRRAISHRMETVGYVPVRNPDDKHDGQWKINQKRQTVYARRELTIADQIRAVTVLKKELTEYVGKSPAEAALMEAMNSDVKGGQSKLPVDNLVPFKKQKRR
jgi:Bifunctional DNA primase/polymerase, N-terminal/Family of unknown function (DUF5906)/Primase C terminal 2 (PriCT-2)